ncbi:Cytochrome c oxidase subunit 6A, mitochondrial [Vanrija pseudolonga]|uniref:Cytochrome c oxidase subunit 6A, mitochondrial n=1 Tax=Vanrija pseudolonga TaxID=143232 RepID=A0AAF1BSM8_9TREE|nr:Cytochrome c oxidase subunit 6A, mitochondrial [Vanrija pseudolonga]
MIRPVLRTSVRAARTFSTEAGAAGNDFVAQRAAVKAHAKDTTALWRNISFFACIPAIIGGSFWAYKLEADHHHHLEHLKEENGGELPHPPAYEYLNIRIKPFPWGMQSLFFNPDVNQKVESA